MAAASNSHLAKVSLNGGLYGGGGSGQKAWFGEGPIALALLVTFSNEGSELSLWFDRDEDSEEWKKLDFYHKNISLPLRAAEASSSDSKFPIKCLSWSWSSIEYCWSI